MEIEKSLETLYNEIENNYNNYIINNNILLEEKRQEILLKLFQINEIIKKEDFYSLNENINEIKTNEIRYKNINYYIGLFYSNCNINNIRLNNLKQAKNYYFKYLNDCYNINILDDDEKKFFNDYEVNKIIYSFIYILLLIIYFLIPLFIFLLLICLGRKYISNHIKK